MRIRLSILAISAILIVSGFSSSLYSQVNESDSKNQDVTEEIVSLLTVQSKCWNDEDLEGFMQTYWKSEQLTFSSGGKTTRGWQATLDRYKRRYPAGSMGHLTFDHLETTLLGDSAALVLGQWHLKYETEQKDGNFSLVLQKFESGWKIIHDHSSMIEVNE